MLPQSPSLILLVLAASAFASVIPTAAAQVPAQCLHYGFHARQRHEPKSTGKWNLSYARPAPHCRTFRLKELEDELIRMKGVIKDPDLYRLFENSWPSTLDTTIAWRGFADPVLARVNMEKEQNNGMPKLDADNNSNLQSQNGQGGLLLGSEEISAPTDEELTFIVTGDIPAMWLRDSANQLQAYTSLLKPSTSPDSLASLFRGAINLQARYILTAPFCNAFQAPAESSIKRTRFLNSDEITPAFDRMSVSSCQWELDSLASFLMLSHDYLSATKDTAFFSRHNWKAAVETILDTAETMTIDSYDDDGTWLHTNYTYCAPYGGTPINNCNGSPHRGGIGLVRSFHRPSDDACTFQYLVPSNMMFAVALERTAPLMVELEGGATTLSDHALSTRMKAMARGIRNGITRHAHIPDATYGTIFPYELDGYGSTNLMDDANLPSLLSAPLLGYLDLSDPVYQNTRRKVLSRDNPYYAWGRVLSGVGSPHTLPGRVWPMSLVAQAMTSEDEDEVAGVLAMLVRSTDGLGVLHESVAAGDAGVWTREWFSWANGLFGQMVLDLEKRMPGVLARSFQGD